MKIVETKDDPAVSFGTLLERIEIMRTALRWQQKLERPQIDKLLSQCTSLREEVLRISHTERFVKASIKGGDKGKRSLAQRRKDLLERDFVFEGVFGESRQLLDSRPDLRLSTTSWQGGKIRPRGAMTASFQECARQKAAPRSDSLVQADEPSRCRLQASGFRLRAAERRRHSSELRSWALKPAVQSLKPVTERLVVSGSGIEGRGSSCRPAF